MSRSVSHLNNAEVILYFPYDEENNESFAWQDLKDNLINEITKYLPSFYASDKWDNRETLIILENNYCNIGISEYCGLVSLSTSAKNSDYNIYINNFGKAYANKIEKTLKKVLKNLGLSNYNKIGTFSNGEGVYEKENG